MDDDDDDDGGGGGGGHKSMVSRSNETFDVVKRPSPLPGPLPAPLLPLK